MLISSFPFTSLQYFTSVKFDFMQFSIVNLNIVFNKSNKNGNWFDLYASKCENKLYISDVSSEVLFFKQI